MYNTERENVFNFFGLIFLRFVLANPCLISNKIPWSIQSSKQRRFTVLINIFSRSHVSYCPFVWMWYEFCITEYLGFTYKKKHSSCQCLLVRNRSVSIRNDNWNFQLPNNVRTLKVSPQKYLLIFVSREPL